MKTLEQKAVEVGNDKKLLKKRLDYAKSVLTEYWRRIMSTPKTVFDLKNKRMVSPFGYVLQWKLRHRPDEPESYENQQTSVGCVELMVLEQSNLFLGLNNE